LMRKMKLTIKSALPENSISHFVHSFWMVENKGEEIPLTLLPHGMVDLSLMKINSGEWKLSMRGIDTMFGRITMTANTIIFSIAFKLLAVEYLFGNSVKEVLNKEINISNDFWQFQESDLKSLETFCKKATQKINSIAPENIDSRKKKLFELIYSSYGSITVKELSEKSYWSCRQINSYFNQQFGIPLKAYCKVLRFSASLEHLSEGKLFPEQNFTDQNHFIKEIKKYAGVTPKVLSKNEGDHFIDILTIKELPS
ncbi:MAG: AraC family transcriptional regulator, partial [Flavobacterium sp.]